MLDLTKPVETRDGRKVEILSTKARGPKPIIGYIGAGLSLASWWPSGSSWEGADLNNGDLVNVPEKKFVNVYKNVNGWCNAGTAVFSSKEEAEKYQNAEAQGARYLGVFEYTEE